MMRNFSKSEIYNNTFIDVTDSWIMDSGASEDAEDMDILCNVFVNAPKYESIGRGLVAEYNAYYNAKQYAAPGKYDIVYSSADDSRNDKLCFKRKKWTGSETFCIPHALTTAKSPHKELCANARVGSRSNTGIDNALSTKSAAGAVLEEFLPSGN
jgi:hypothetical protein